MSKLHLFVSNRDVMVSSILGHSIQFTKGVPIHVPKIMHKTVIERGILPVDGVEAASDIMQEAESGPKIVLAPEDPAEREEAVAKACKAIAERNNAKDFTGGGTPNATAVTAALGWKVDQKEVKDVWLEVRKTLKVS